MTVLLTVIGVLIIALGLWDIHHTLLHPSGKGALSHRLMRLVWAVSRRSGHRLGSIVGPATMIVTIVVWVVLQILGWALIYLPHVPAGFLYSPGIDPARYTDFFEALYISAVTLATLGFGDVVVIEPWLRMASPLEALTGFALLTAALTWFMQIYPPLSRRRALALELKALADTGYAEQLEALDPVVATRVLHSLASDISKARIDFTQHTETYYFQEEDPDLSLSHQLSYALKLRDAAAASASPNLQAAAALLDRALEQLATKLQDDFVDADGDRDSVFAAYAADHGRAPRV